MRALLIVLLLCVLCKSSIADRDCGGVFEENDFLIEYTSDEISRRSNVTCEYIFKGANCATTFVFNFLDFYLQDEHNCSASGLVIDDKETICGIKDGTTEYYSRNGLFRVKFYSYRFHENQRFKIFVQKSSCFNDSFVSKHVKRSILHEYCKTYEVPSPYGPTAHQKFSSYYQNPSYWPSINQQTMNENFCCANKYSDKNFIITSPHFPRIKNNPVDCVYHIYRANENICRLRLNFLFYWNGYQSNYGCQNGHLEIDGKMICGCRVGLKLISVFDMRNDGGPKIIRYKSNGQPATALHGFAVEIVQDECPTTYSPEHIQISNSFHRYRRWIHQNNVDVQSPIYLNDGGNGNEETYIYTTHFNPFLPSGADNHKCKVWGVVQWGVLTKKALWKKIPKCTNTPASSKCIEISTKQGCLKSPGYPFYYPNNLNLCYRFIKLPGYCSLKLTMLDFMIQDSYQCTKDFLLLANANKFCGARLYNTYSHLTFSNGIFEDMLFVTDNAFSCRGFKVWFEQIPCQFTTQTTPITYPTTFTTSTTTTTTTTRKPTTTSAATTFTTTRPTTSLETTTTSARPTTTSATTTTTTVRPTTTSATTTVRPTTTSMTTTTTRPTTVTTVPTTTTEMTTTTTTTAAPEYCYKEYRERGFIIEHYGYENNVCTFTVFKSSPDVCSLNLQYIVFDLPCENEYLLINGNRYCGRINSSDIDFIAGSITILYYRQPTYNPFNLRLQIIGTQEVDCIPDPEVFPERLEEEEKQYETEVVENEIKGYNIIIKNINPNMCGLVIKTYVYNDDMEKDMCSMLRNVEDRHNCILMPDHSFYAPYVDGKIILVVATMEIYDNMQLKEVRCGNDEVSEIATSDI